MRTIATIMLSGACLAAVLTSAGCTEPAQGGTPTTDPPTQEQTPTDPPAEEQTPAPLPSPEEAPTQQWAMPDLVGSTLQDAQDQIQATTGDTVFFTESHDLTGADRSQVLDANWTVCTQNVPAGDPLTTTSKIDFGVVKVGESCS